MIGDTSFANIFEEECLLLYMERASLTRQDIEQLPPFEREGMMEMFKQFNAKIQKDMDDARNKQK